MRTKRSYGGTQVGVLIALLTICVALGACARRPTEPSQEPPSVAQPQADCANFTLTMMESSTTTARGSVDYAAVGVNRIGQFKGTVRLSFVKESAPNLFTDWKFDPNPTDGLSAWEFTTANDPSLRGTTHNVIVRGDDADPASNSWCTVSHAITVFDQ